MIAAFEKWRISAKLLVVYMAVTGVVLATAFTILMRMEVTSSKENEIRNMTALAEIIAERSATAVAFADVESAVSNLRALRSHESIVYACVKTSENKVFAEYRKVEGSRHRCGGFAEYEDSSIDEGFVNVYKPIKLDNESVASIQIKSSLKQVNELIVKSINVVIAMFVVLMVLSALVSKRAMGMITDPISRMKEIAERISNEQDYSLRMEKGRNDEVGVLVGSFNNMLEQISLRDEELIKAKEKAENSALAARKLAETTQQVNLDLENEIRERARIEEQLQDLNETLEEKVQERTAELKELNEKIGDIARSAGMAEVASGVLHNVGNVLNSVNVSASVIREKVRKNKADNLLKVVKMIEENNHDLANYISQDDKGRQIPRFLSLLCEQIMSDKEAMFHELDELVNNIDHIKNIISMQQSYAGSYGVREKVDVSGLVEDALKINMQGMDRHGIEVQRDYSEVPMVYADKHKFLQVVINLISNAKYATIDNEKDEKNIKIIVHKQGDFISVEVKDTGVGIAEGDLPHLFEYGFKKRRGGHGFGLHHSALVANELGGRIKASSEGLGKGACFTLMLPIERVEDK